MLETRLGKLPAEAQALENISDPERLQRLTDALIEAADVDSTLAALRDFAR